MQTATVTGGGGLKLHVQETGQSEREVDYSFSSTTYLANAS